MTKQILFIQGAGENAHKEDAKLVESLKDFLGSLYQVNFPVMRNEEDPRYEVWVEQIKDEINVLKGNVILVGHSVGASILIKFLSEQPIKNVDGVFLIAAPFWGGAGWKYDGYEKLVLPKDLASTCLKSISLFLYHAQDDEIVPFSHLALYLKKFPDATIREISSGGHQLDNDLRDVAADIKTLNGKQVVS